MSVDPIFWLLAAIGFVVLEAMTLNLVSIWFAGQPQPLLSCLVTGSFRVQAVVIAVSNPLPAGLKAPSAVGCASRLTATNGDRALGREAIALHLRLRRGHRPCPADGRLNAS